MLPAWHAGKGEATLPLAASLITSIQPLTQIQNALENAEQEDKIVLRLSQ